MLIKEEASIFDLQSWHDTKKWAIKDAELLELTECPLGV